MQSLAASRAVSSVRTILSWTQHSRQLFSCCRPVFGRYYFKSTRQAAKANDAPRRFVLQPGALPEDVRLAADAGRLRGWVRVK